MTRRNATPSTAGISEGDRKTRATTLMAMAWNMMLPASARLAAIEGAEMLLRDAGDGPISFTIEPAGDLRETHWGIVLACMTAGANRTTSARHAQDVIEVAAQCYRPILETQPAARRAEEEFAPRLLWAVHVLEAVLAQRAKAEGLELYGA